MKGESGKMLGSPGCGSEHSTPLQSLLLLLLAVGHAVAQAPYCDNDQDCNSPHGRCEKRFCTCSGGWSDWRCMTPPHAPEPEPCTVPSTLPPHAQSAGQDGCDAGAPLKNGEHCGIVCIAGFAQKQAAGVSYAYTCDGGQLEPAAPDCQECGIDEANPTPGASACAECDDGKSTHGLKGQSECTTDAPLPEPEPDPQPDCSAEPPNPNEYWLERGGTACKLTDGAYPAQSQCLASCDEGFEPTPAGYPLFECGSVKPGEWAGDYVCQKKLAPTPLDPPDKSIWWWFFGGMGGLALCTGYSCTFGKSQWRGRSRFSVIVGWAVTVVACAVTPIAVALVAADYQGSPAEKWHWHVACVSVTLASKLPLPHIIRNFKTSLEALPHLDPPLEDDEKSVGLFGLLMFVWGVVDFVRGPLLCTSLALRKEWVLFACSVTTLSVTTVVTVYLAFQILDSVARSSTEARLWKRKQRTCVALVAISSSSRLDMLSIFRLRICDRQLVDLPMEDRHFHFIRNSGMFHHLIEDIPHGLVGVAAIVLSDGDSGGDVDLRPDLDWLDDGAITKLSTVVSICSIVFGLFNKTIQLNQTSGESILASVDRVRTSLGGSRGSDGLSAALNTRPINRTGGGSTIGGSE